MQQKRVIECKLYAAVLSFTWPVLFIIAVAALELAIKCLY